VFELSDSRLTLEERELVLSHRFASVKLDSAAAEKDRAASWRALEAARVAGKARFIGVSNYPAALVQSMASNVSVMPAVNQLELHPRFSSPTLRAYASESGMALTAYGSGNSANIEKNVVVARIAADYHTTPIDIVLRWTLQKGIAVIPRTATPAHMVANLASAAAPALTKAEVAQLDALNEDHPYYWHPAPLFPAGTYKRDC
jgi:2,5-diketo-D-gluconate reductase A